MNPEHPRRLNALVAAAVLAYAEALASKAITIEQAEQVLFSPRMLTRLRRAGASKAAQELVHLGTELEDVADALPERLQDTIDELRKAARLALRKECESTTAAGGVMCERLVAGLAGLPTEANRALALWLNLELLSHRAQEHGYGHEPRALEVAIGPSDLGCFTLSTYELQAFSDRLASTNAKYSTFLSSDFSRPKETDSLCPGLLMRSERSFLEVQQSGALVYWARAKSTVSGEEPQWSFAAREFFLVMLMASWALTNVAAFREAHIAIRWSVGGRMPLAREFSSWRYHCVMDERSGVEALARDALTAMFEHVEAEPPTRMRAHEELQRLVSALPSVR